MITPLFIILLSIIVFHQKNIQHCRSLPRHNIAVCCVSEQ